MAITFKVYGGNGRKLSWKANNISIPRYIKGASKNGFLIGDISDWVCELLGLFYSDENGGKFVIKNITDKEYVKYNWDFSENSKEPSHNRNTAQLAFYVKTYYINLPLIKFAALYLPYWGGVGITANASANGEDVIKTEERVKEPILAVPAKTRRIDETAADQFKNLKLKEKMLEKLSGQNH